MVGTQPPISSPLLARITWRIDRNLGSPDRPFAVGYLPEDMLYDDVLEEVCELNAALRSARLPQIILIPHEVSHNPRCTRRFERAKRKAKMDELEKFFSLFADYQSVVVSAHSLRNIVGIELEDPARNPTACAVSRSLRP